MRSLTSAFNNFKVSTKIAAGFSVILSLMVAVGAYGYISLSHVGNDVEGYAEHVGVVDTVSEIDREFLSYRRIVREVASEKDAAAATKLAEEEEQRVKAAIEKGIKTIHDPEEHAKVEEIKERFEEYAKLARKAEAARHEKDEIGHKVLDANGQKLKADLEDMLKLAAREGNSNAIILGSEALKDVMQIQISANLLLGRQDDAAKSSADQAFEDVKTVIATLDTLIVSPEARKDLEDVKVLLADYEKSYLHAMELDHTLDEIMSKELPALANVVA
jgi:hypothetical protein